MKLRYRRLLYLSFITVFLIITPAIILQTSGYSYNFKKGKIEKTGILYVDSRPDKADIYLNGKLVGQTMQRFPKLLPDTYRLEVKKEGYKPWQKEIEIKSNLTEFAQDIVLFKDALPTNLAAKEINLFYAFPENQAVIYSIIEKEKEELRFFNLNDKSENTLKIIDVSLGAQTEMMAWSEDQSRAVFKTDGKNTFTYFMVNTKTGKIEELDPLMDLNLSQIGWGLENDVNLYGLGSDGIYQIGLNGQKNEKAVIGKISNFIFNGNTLFYLSQENGEEFLNRKIFGVQAAENEISKIKLPQFSAFRLEKSRLGYITLLDHLSHDLFILSENAFADENIENNIILQEKANEIIWSKKNNLLLYYNDLEIWTYNLLTQQKELLTRYSEPVKGALWYPGDKYVIYLIGNKVGAIEATAVKTKNDTLLAELSEICCLSLDSRGKELFFKARAGNVSGIYQLTLQ